MSVNALILYLCFCWEFGRDTRSLILMIVHLPTLWLCLTVDACCSEFEFGIRRLCFAFLLSVLCVMIAFNEAGFYFDAKDPEVILKTSPWTWSRTNATAVETADDQIWATQSVYNLRSIGDMRGM